MSKTQTSSPAAQSKTGKTAALITALAAGLVYGGWAFYANYEYGSQIAGMAGGIQGLYAFLSTLSISHVARWVFLKYKCGIKGISAGFTASFVVMLAIPLGVHSLIGTPNIWMTILPGLIWGSIYLMGLLISLEWKLKISPAKQAKKDTENTIKTGKE